VVAMMARTGMEVEIDSFMTMVRMAMAMFELL
jgi:hypothetical protein